MVYNFYMDILEIIDKKREGKKLSKEEIQFFVENICSKKIKDYQITSLLMAICTRGLDDEEVFNLTFSMAHSGKIIDMSDIGMCVDKHSTGGVSDTTTLVVVPILASLGVKVAKMSGRSLGFTGGTAEKVEVFKGYQTEIDTQKFKQLITKNGASIVSQSEEFAPADKIIYKLRSDSGTVENIGLIASSIMSKKIACGAKILILDCKTGNGALLKSVRETKKLAVLMRKIGEFAGIKVCAVISSMDQPLTKYIGNNFEVYSSLMALRGEKGDLLKLSTFLASKALILSGRCKTMEKARFLVNDVIENGKALEKLKQIVQSQNGDIKYIDSPDDLLKHKNSFDIFSKKDGYIAKI